MVYTAVLVLLAVVFGSFVEWMFHKHILHGVGKSKKSVWNSHWHDHHKTARKHDMVDGFYYEPLKIQLKAAELKSIVVCCFVFLGLSFLILTPFFLTLTLYSFCYYGAHALSHRNRWFAKKVLAHHYDHHLGKNQDANWCVLFPLADYVLGTREIT